MSVAAFSRNPVVEFLPDGRRVRIARSFTFRRASGERITVPRAFECDGISSPFVLWSLNQGAFVGRSRDAALVHDYLYATQRTNKRPISRKDADTIFREAMRARHTTWVVATAKYWAVRLFSRGGWRPIPVTPSS